jgi:glycerol uptake facilitator-like aquaporin
MALLLLVIFCTTDPNNKDRPAGSDSGDDWLISLLGPLTMACFNLARGLGPRLFSSSAGWNSVPFTANGMGRLTVHIPFPPRSEIA